MAPFRTRNGETPRRVQIERKKRAFAQLDVDALFRATPDADALVAAPHALPLEAFDDTDHEVRASAEWLQVEALESDSGLRAKVRVVRLQGCTHSRVSDRLHGLYWLSSKLNRVSTRNNIVAVKSGIQPPYVKVALYARTNKTGYPIWAMCAVVGGNAEMDTYNVRLDKNKKTLTGIPRVDLCFDSEDPEAFVLRRRAAYAVGGLCTS
jgi:hypothetical protein